MAFAVFVVAVGLSVGLVLEPAAGFITGGLLGAAGYAARQVMRDS